MQSFTVDASIALKWVSLEKELYLDKARLLFTKAVKKEIILIAPTLLKAEFANVLLKKKKLSVYSSPVNFLFLKTIFSK